MIIEGLLNMEHTSMIIWKMYKYLDRRQNYPFFVVTQYKSDKYTFN
jgi:hypothetical protein